MIPTVLDSYCATCDALPDECEHGGTRYLEPITYETDPLLGGFVVPDFERERWENPPLFTPAAPLPAESAITLADLTAELERADELSPALETLLGTTYERNPLKVSRIVRSVLDGAASGSIRSVSGLLWHRLRELRT